MTMHLISNLADLYWKLLNTEDALADGNFPPSTAYEYVGDCPLFGWFVQAGALDSVLTFQVKQDKSATETANIKNVSTAAITVSATGDDKWYLIQVDPRYLDINNGFAYVTLALSGAAGVNDFAAIFFFKIVNSKPAVQPTGAGGVGEIVTIVG